MKKILGSALGACFVVSAPAGAAPKPTELHFGSEPWHLVLSLGDLKPTEGAPSSVDRKVFTYADDRGSVLSVIVEDAHRPAIMASCRDVFAGRKAEMQPDNETQGQRGDSATQEYDLKLNFQGKPIVQHNVFSCRTRGNYYIDVHASHVPYQPSDHDALMALMAAVAIID
jgi:hypothetical protein